YPASNAYAFNIAYTDPAGNVAAAPAENESEASFVVDAELPEIEIVGIADRTAYNAADILPTVTFIDSGNLLEGDETGGALDITLTRRGFGEEAASVDSLLQDVAQGETVNLAYHNDETTRLGDGIYTLTAKATDNAGNEYEQELVYSVNRWGSTWYTADATNDMVEQYYTNDPVDLEIHEINPNNTVASELVLSLGDTAQSKLTEGLSDGRGYKRQSTGSADVWYEHVYTVPATNFDRDGIYSLAISTQDEPGNSSSLRTPKDDPGVEGDEPLEIKFYVDTTAPELSVTGIEEGGRYSSDTQAARINVYDDTLDSVGIYIDDDAVPADSFTGAEIVRNGGYADYLVGTSGAPVAIRLAAHDLAGNTTEYGVNDVLVNPDAFVQLVNNPVALAFAIGGGILGLLILAGLVFLIASGTLARLIGSRSAKQAEGSPAS
ncbi:MAG: hypothetical protein LBK67_06755, partial [Coriobacteriales bacterium]|nr:hypothetical protein [Coriobacteriales bacterium]